MPELVVASTVDAQRKGWLRPSPLVAYVSRRMLNPTHDQRIPN